ncbi:CASP-like protein 4A1 isoform X2 [Cynara cardunculus var. scolymus]|uniref:CASP-like protein 4A1 isoform X2 n=1 Tax=Cynara cardunculus var. scolymus TaxID=59895 RepID=UPI000D62788A|nr:CASP-like protein 4A1 isoform X2 [Cynara cardunculus var. scolymus]
MDQKRQVDVDSPAISSSGHLRDRRSQPSPPARSAEDSPLSTMSPLSSLSHGFSPERDEVEPESEAGVEASQGSPPLYPLPDLSAVRVTSPAPVPTVNRYVRDETMSIKKTDHGAKDGYVGRPVEEAQTGGGGQGRRWRPSVGSVRRTDKEGSMKKIALGFRIFELLFCLVSLSVMATDKRQGWALDSFYRYKEFRYSMAVNVVGFAYAVLQGFDLAYQLATGNHYNRRHTLRYYFDFAMDQMLTYLLISSGSSAATRVDDWKSNWGADKFPELATASVGLGFVAFVAFAFSSVISGYLLYASTSS